jgi:hypothetical protein
MCIHQAEEPGLARCSYQAGVLVPRVVLHWVPGWGRCRPTRALWRWSPPSHSQSSSAVLRPLVAAPCGSRAAARWPLAHLYVLHHRVQAGEQPVAVLFLGDPAQLHAAVVGRGGPWVSAALSCPLMKASSATSSSVASHCSI